MHGVNQEMLRIPINYSSICMITILMVINKKKENHSLTHTHELTEWNMRKYYRLTEVTESIRTRKRNRERKKPENMKIQRDYYTVTDGI